MRVLCQQHGCLGARGKHIAVIIKCDVCTIHGGFYSVFTDISAARLGSAQQSVCQLQPDQHVSARYKSSRLNGCQPTWRHNRPVPSCRQGGQSGSHCQHHPTPRAWRANKLRWTTSGTKPCVPSKRPANTVSSRWRMCKTTKQTQIWTKCKQHTVSPITPPVPTLSNPFPAHVCLQIT